MEAERARRAARAREQLQAEEGIGSKAQAEAFLEKYTAGLPKEMAEAIKTGGEAFGTPAEAEKAKEALRELLGLTQGPEDKQSKEDMKEAVKEGVKEGMKEAAAEGGGQTVINNHNQHQRIVYPDREAVQRETINAQSDQMRREVG